MRYILHADLNNFYASVECLYNPSIRNCAVVVVGDQEKRHGIVLSKNYNAKKYKIKTGDTVWEAKQKCLGEKLITVNARFEVYKQISELVKNVYRSYSDKVESFGIDEAWIDITDQAKSFKEAYSIAEKLRKQIVTEFGLTISVGVSYNKIFAKLGSDLKKPNATTLITNQNYKTLVWTLPAEDLLYVGRATKEKLNKANINTIGDIANTNPTYLRQLLGVNGLKLYDFANGYDNTPVKKTFELEKSIGNSTTCPRDLKTLKEVETIIYLLAESVVARLRKKNLWCLEVGISIKDNNLFGFERQKKLSYPTNLISDIAKECMSLFNEHFDWQHTIRALGVRVSKLCDEPTQQNLFIDYNQNHKKMVMESMVEVLRQRFGYNIIKRANIASDADFVDLNIQNAQHSIHPFSYFKP